MQKRNIWILSLLLLFVALTAGCGQKERRITDGSEVYVKPQTAAAQDEPKEEETEEIQSVEEIYVITAIDEARKMLTLQSCEEPVEIPYEYTGGTYVKDKYGKNLTVSQLSLGELVTIDVQGGKLSLVKIAQDAFSYDDLHNFTLDRDMQSLTVGSSIYYFDKDLLAYYGDRLIPLSELSEQDTVCIKGVGQQIYTLQVTTGHGIVTLENIELFLDGYITIGNVLSQKITPQMRLEVPEGTYLLSVANDGYGGSREITVEADREIKVNLDELKGDGPKLCSVQFEKPEPENAQVFLDGEQVDLTQTIQVRYGEHRLTAKAEGYVDWQRTLIVNSATAKIKIEMTTIEEAEEEETISTSNPPKSNTNSNTNNNNTGNTNNNSTNNNSNNNNNSTNNNSNNSNNNSNNNNNNSTNNNSNRNNNSNNNSNNNNNNSTNNNNNTLKNHETHEDEATRRHLLMFLLS